MKKIILKSTLLVALSTFTSLAIAGEADVVKAKITKSVANTFSFSVTVKHGDTGWDHYADRWEILDSKGNILGTRVLFHPHVEEQPFTRSLSGLKIPTVINSVTIRAHDKVHKYGGKQVTVKVPR